MTSTRLPGKVLRPLLNKPVLELMIERVRRARLIDGIVIATTNNAADDRVAALAARLGIGCHRGSEEDVLQRVLDAATIFEATTIVELTGDCPLIDPAIIDQAIADHRLGGVDYVSNVLQRSYPIGMDTQVFDTAVLADVARRTDDATDREHVSLFIYRNPQLYRLRNIGAPADLTRPDLPLTLDTPEDFSLIEWIYQSLYPKNPAFSLRDALTLLDAHPERLALNAHIRRKHA